MSAPAPALPDQSAWNGANDICGFELYRGGRVIGFLLWRADPRAAAGWYLRRGAGPVRRLGVDAAIDGLAVDAVSDRSSWQERAASVRALSAPLALDAADRALRGGLQRARSRLLAAGDYELHVTGVGAATLGIVCPALSVVAAGDTSVLCGALDDEAMRAVVRRVNLLGGRVLAIFRGHARASGAADRSVGSPERRRVQHPGLAPS